MNKQMIKEIVDNYFELNLKRNTRKRQYVEARAIFYKLCREFTKLSLEEIGKQVDRDHASVLHGIRSLNNWIEYDNRIKNNLRILRNKVRNFEDEKDNVIELDESIVLKYVQLKEQVKEQEEIINDLRKALADITEKHTRREKFYQKYGFIN
jgi:hypothetical protein